MSTFSRFGRDWMAFSIGLESAYPGIPWNSAAGGQMAFGNHKERGISASSYAIPRIDLDRVHLQ